MTRQRSIAVRQDDHFAQVDMGIFGLPLFQPLQRQTGKKEGGSSWRLNAREFVTEFDGEQIRVISPYALSSDDLGILLAVLSCAGQYRRARVLMPDQKEHHRQALESQMSAKGALVSLPHIVVVTTLQEILAMAGVARNPDTLEQAKQKLRRLRAVFCEREGTVGNKRVARSTGEEQLIGYDSLTETGEIRITISERLSAAILGTPFARVSLPLYRRLSSEVARILYVRLCVAIREGERRTKDVDDLVEYVYGSPDPAKTWTQQQVYDRRRAIRNALEQIASLQDWHIEQAKSAYTLSRMRRPRRREQKFQVAPELCG